MKVRYSYARQIPTRYNAFDRIEVELEETCPEDIPISQFLYELREMAVDECDAAERDIYKKT